MNEAHTDEHFPPVDPVVLHQMLGQGNSLSQRLEPVAMVPAFPTLREGMLQAIMKIKSFYVSPHLLFLSLSCPVKFEQCSQQKLKCGHFNYSNNKKLIIQFPQRGKVQNNCSKEQCICVWVRQKGKRKNEKSVADYWKFTVEGKINL